VSAPDLRRISDVAPLVQSRALSSSELVRGCLDAIATQQTVNAFTTLFEANAIDDARRADAEIAAGSWRGPLHGIPVAVKDLIDVAGTPTTSASAVPCTAAQADAPVIQRLRDAGAILIGKTNLHEFAYGTTSEESAFGPVRNPWDLARSAGGSSGGSAAALAAGMCFGALGTDTGGSIRIPSAACGTVGLKPTYGELPLTGIVPLSGSFDHVGPMARSVADAALMFLAMRGASQGALEPDAEPITFAVPRRYFWDRVDEDVASALSRVRSALLGAGHRVVDADIVDVERTPDIYLHIMLPEASWYHAPMLERHAARYSPGVRLRLEMGRYVRAEDYVRASHLRTVLRDRVNAAFTTSRADVLLVPALPIAAPPLGAQTVTVSGTQEPVRGAMLRLTQVFNVTGHPAIALPAGVGRDGLPRGVQLVGRDHRTDHLLRVALAVEDQISGGAGSVGGGTG
jgi:aspartyl-tRNA(Asn)/glutamyl-tRNA(Gln) amidotransferase subunit A